MGTYLYLSLGYFREEVSQNINTTPQTEDREEATKGKKILPHIFSAIVRLLTFFIVRFEMRFLLLPISLSISYAVFFSPVFAIHSNDY